jgi:hypothetical protein
MAAGDHHPSSPDPYPPKNTVVVMPKAPPMNRSALWVVFWGVGLVMGLVLRSMIDGPATTPSMRLPRPQLLKPEM